MTGSRFQRWLETEKAGNQRAMVEAEKYVKWESLINTQERAKENKKRESAHQARVAQIIEYCGVRLLQLETKLKNLNPPITTQTLHLLKTFQREFCGTNSLPLSIDAFSEKPYFKWGVPKTSHHHETSEHQFVSRASLKSILELEVRQLEKERKMREVKMISNQIFEKNLPGWLASLKITVLPPNSQATVTLFDSIIVAWSPFDLKTGIKLRSGEFPFFDTFCRKLALCFPAFGDRIYKIEYYDRSSLLYCGYCDDHASAKNPMSLKQMNDHLGYFHKDEIWKVGMIRQSPPGQPVFDGHCVSCNIPLLVAASFEETKSGVECKTCHRKYCFQCMDKRVWLGADHQKRGIIPAGKYRFSTTGLTSSDWSDVLV